MRVRILATVACAGIAVVCGAENWTGICRGVVDGDTIEVLKAGEVVLVELVEIDAPELGQPWGDEAKTFLEDIVMDREVLVIDRKRLQGGAVEARVHVGDVDVDQEILAVGLAWTGDTMDYGGGKWLFLFKLDLTRGVGVSCDCSDGKQCACSIELAPVKK